MTRSPYDTGLRDKNDRAIFQGDRVRYWNQSKNIKQEYWNPEYEVIWKAPAFTLMHMGGGKDPGNYSWMMSQGGGARNLEVVARGAHHLAAEMTKNLGLNPPTPEEEKPMTFEEHEDRIREARAKLEVVMRKAYEDGIAVAFVGTTNPANTTTGRYIQISLSRRV